jgi:ubiquinone/menaquinone biosynthesis C-methylase UbiE
LRDGPIEVSLISGLLHEIVARPLIYDWVQRAAGFERTLKRLRPHFNELEGQTILDVGAGTGNYVQIMPASRRYIWMDNDPQKLQGFRAKALPGLTILGDATRIPLRDQSVDVVFCCALSHHLTDAEAGDLFRELARICRRKLIFLDAVDNPRSIMSRLMWKYDRGSHPRSAEHLHALIAESFKLVYCEEYSIYHSYRLWIGGPKRLEG